MRLRDPRYDVGIKACGAKHKWLHFPKHAADIYYGLRAKSIAFLREVKALEEDSRISQSYYAGR